MKTFILDEIYRCKVGMSANENWKLLDSSNPDDTFFHLNSLPSCYVILEEKKIIPEKILTECAKICLENTKFRNMRGIYVDCTPVKNVRKGDDIGEIEYVSTRQVRKIRI